MTDLEAIGCTLEDPRRHTSGLQNPDEHEIIVVPPAHRELTLNQVRLIEVQV